VRQEWDLEDLIAVWTLVENDWALIANKSGPTRLGFALLLKFFELEGRFPEGPEEVPGAVVDYLAAQLGVDPPVFAKYAWSGRSIGYHRAQIRTALGFRKASRVDATDWRQTERPGGDEALAKTACRQVTGPGQREPRLILDPDPRSRGAPSRT